VDDETLVAVVEGIPEGCWMSYADPTTAQRAAVPGAAAGGSARQALGLNGRLTRLGNLLITTACSGPTATVCRNWRSSLSSPASEPSARRACRATAVASM